MFCHSSPYHQLQSLWFAHQVCPAQKAQPWHLTHWKLHVSYAWIFRIFLWISNVWCNKTQRTGLPSWQQIWTTETKFGSIPPKQQIKKNSGVLCLENIISWPITVPSWFQPKKNGEHVPLRTCFFLVQRCARCASPSWTSFRKCLGQNLMASLAAGHSFQPGKNQWNLKPENLVITWSDLMLIGHT